MDLKNLKPFESTAIQRRAKARFVAAVDSRQGLVSIEALTLGEITKLAGDSRVARWLEDPAFAAWFTDRDTFVTTANALKELAVLELEALLSFPVGDPRDGCVTAKEKLAAIAEIMKITGAYPSRAKVVFADRVLNDMSEDEVVAETAAVRAQLDRKN